jgi:hypothetical protein
LTCHYGGNILKGSYEHLLFSSIAGKELPSPLTEELTISLPSNVKGHKL